jgi:hypothetical protein
VDQRTSSIFEIHDRRDASHCGDEIGRGKYVVEVVNNAAWKAAPGAAIAFNTGHHDSALMPPPHKRRLEADLYGYLMTANGTLLS